MTIFNFLQLRSFYIATLIIFFILSNFALNTQSIKAKNIFKSISSLMRPAATVDKYVITIYDVLQRIEFVLLQSGMSRNSLNRKLIAPRVLDTLIIEKLRLIEANKYSLVPNDDVIAEAVINFELQQNLLPGAIHEQLIHQKIDYRTFVESFRANIAWQNLITEILNPEVTVSDTEVEQEMKRFNTFLEQKHTYEVRLSIILLAGDNRNISLQKDANQILQSLNQGADFSVIARQFSDDLSAQHGGDMGWIDLQIIEGDLHNWLETANIGALSLRPINEGLAIFKIQDRKKIDKSNLNRQRITDHIGNIKLQSKIRSLERSMKQQATIRHMLVL